jgi:phage shock protein A
MDATQEAGWPDMFSREEMLEHQSRLLIEECHLLQKELSRHRKNIAKLIGMHENVTLERDKLRSLLTSTVSQLSDCRRQCSALGNRVTGLESCKDQLEAIHRAQRLSAHVRASTLHVDK